jgi:hypothetical protein
VANLERLWREGFETSAFESPIVANEADDQAFIDALADDE